MDPHEKYFDAWRRSILRSTLVLKHLLGGDDFAPGVRKSRAPLETILTETNDAILKAASAETRAMYDAGAFAGLNKGVTKSSDWPIPVADVCMELEADGWEKDFTVARDGDDEAVVCRLRKGDEEILVQDDGEWAWASGGEMFASEKIRDLQRLYRERA